MLQNRLLLSVVAVLVAGFGFNHFVLSKKKDEKATIEKQIADSNAAIETARASLSANKDAQSGFRSAYGTVVRLGKAVPGDDDVRSLVVQIDHAAKRAGVNFQAINVAEGGSAAAATTAPDAQQLPPGTTIGPAGLPIMPFSFTFSGQFFRLGSFFKQLDTFVKSGKQLRIAGRLMTIDALKLEPAASGFPNIKATVSATTYQVPALEGLTAGASPTGPAGATATTTDASSTTPPATGTTMGATTSSMVTGGYR